MIKVKPLHLMRRMKNSFLWQQFHLNIAGKLRFCDKQVSIVENDPDLDTNMELACSDIAEGATEQSCSRDEVKVEHGENTSRQANYLIVKNSSETC